MLENSSKIKVLWLQPARVADFLYARDVNQNGVFFIYSKKSKVLGFPKDGLIGEFDYFQDTCFKLTAAKYFNEETAKQQLKNIDLLGDKENEKPETVELGKILISEDLISNKIGTIIIDNRSREIICEIQDAGEYTNKTDFNIELK